MRSIVNKYGLERTYKVLILLHLFTASFSLFAAFITSVWFFVVLNTGLCALNLWYAYLDARRLNQIYNTKYSTDMNVVRYWLIVKSYIQNLFK